MTHEELIERVYQFFRDNELALKEIDVDVNRFYRWCNCFSKDYNHTRTASAFIFNKLMLHTARVNKVRSIFPLNKDGSDPWVAQKRFNQSIREVVALRHCVEQLKYSWSNRPFKKKTGGNQ